jgi:LppX_LprAFG lipoprotein
MPSSEVTLYKTPRRSFAPASRAKQFAGIVGFLSTVVGTLLALGIIHPMGGTEDALAATAVTTSDAGSAKLTVSVQAPVNGAPLLLRGDGAYDFRTGRGKLTLHLPPDYAAQLGTPTLKSIIDGDTTYMYLPALDVWEIVEDSPPQSTLDVFTELVPDDPTQILQFLEPGGDVETVGEESVFGTETTHYRATVSVEQLVENAPANVQQAVRASGMVRDGATLPVDVWVDDAGMMRRIELKGQLGTVDNVALTLDLYDFGTDVDVKIPPPSKVYYGG